MKCCAKCFGDRGLRHNVIPRLSSEIGKCSYCEAVDEIVLPPKLLGESFGPVINIYERQTGGKLLIEWLRLDWGLFQSERMDSARAKELLAEILDDGEIVRQEFVPSSRFQSDTLVRWEELRAELMYSNRYFPRTEIDSARFEELLPYLVAKELPENWFRARILDQDELYSIEKMGPPPKRVASHGRANPAGIPYLYLGETAETAVSEVRPHTGDRACVADFAIAKELKLIDLRNPRDTLSPFDLGEESVIGKLRSDVAFLEALGEELTRPVLPQGASIDYVPSQYVCEFIKKTGYDGVIYRSAVGPGMNLALFDPSRARGGKIQEFLVGRITIDIKLTGQKT